MIFHFKQNTSNPLAFAIVDSVTGLGVTGLLYTDFSCKVVKSFGAEVTKTLAPADFAEAGDGWYWIKLSAAECDTLGPGFLVITTGSNKGAYPFQIVANTSADVMALLGTPTSVGGTIVSDIAAISGGGGGALETTCQAIKAKTDNLPAVPAAVSDVQTVGTAVANLSTSLNSKAAEILAQGGKNSKTDQYVYSGSDLTSARQRAWDTSANAAAGGATGLLYTWTWTFTYSAPGVLSSASMVTVP